LRRIESLLTLLAVAMAAFVGVAIARAPRSRARALIDRTLAAGARQVELQARVPEVRDVAVDTRRAPDPPATRDLADVRGRIASGAPGTYLLEMLAGQDSMIVRWPDRRAQGLRIWVEGSSAVQDWNAADIQMARDAFSVWASAGTPIRLDFILDSIGSDVQVFWVDRFPAELGRRIGATTRINDQNGWLVEARMRIALHDSTGRTFPPAELSAIIGHEAGHALGLGHSNDPHTIMYPLQTARDISNADRATLRLLYTLAPGSVR
jgi:Zn-dependent protease with chaperone function